MNREKLFKYIRKHFLAEPEYLWNKFPGYAVFRHNKSKKWFGIVMNVPGEKLSLEKNEMVDVLNVKVKSEHIEFLLQMEGIYPAYHMNKSHWISVLLNGSISAQEIYELLSDSYSLTS